MSELETPNRGTNRGILVRNAIVFQLKLMADGLRDLVLLPVSLIATIVGLIRGGDDAGRELNQVIDLGRETEAWINLFGNHDPDEDSNMGTSIDVVFQKAEEVLKQQYKADGTSKSAQTEIDKTLQTVRNQAGKAASKFLKPRGDQENPPL